MLSILSINHSATSSPLPPSRIPLTTPTTIPTITTPPGCLYNGQYYPLGQEINSGYDPTSNWCWWTICGEDGYVMSADNFNCKTTVSPMTTTPDTPPSIPDRLWEGIAIGPDA